MDPDVLKNAVRQIGATPERLFSTINIISRYVMENGASDRASLDAIIRLRELADKGSLHPAIADAIYSLCREAGLFPYLPQGKIDWRDQVAVEFFRGPPETNYVFHRDQWQAFQLLASGKSLILSAPTSFGKSILIHAYIAQQRPKTTVIVVPTIALLDQFRRTMARNFGADYSIITRNDQISDAASNRIFVLTQERLLDRNDIDEIDLLAIDEYYKLDDTRERGESNRAITLNTAVRKYLYIAKQIFFLGPTAASVAMRDDLRSKFTEFPSNTSTVAVDIIDHTSTTEPYKTLASLLREHQSEKSLIYSKSPPAAVRLVDYLSQRAPMPIDDEIAGFAEWLAEHYHPSWSLVSALRAGYGVHHGSVPRSVAQSLVRYFNEGHLQALICTSTLIEGVNTAAKNVFILDKKISTKNYDFFDFRNIAGRSGRMGHHLVGRIFLFHAPPEPRDYEIHVPALAEDPSIPDAMLINLPDESLSDELRQRKEDVLNRYTLPPDLISRFARYGIGAVERVSTRISELLDKGDRGLLWRDYVGYQELNAVFSVAWNDLRFNKKRLSPSRMAFFANRLRLAQILRTFFDRLLEDKDELEHRDIIELAFRALGAFDYSIPTLLMDMEELVNYHCARRGLEPVSYALMAQKLDNLFCHHWVKALDEYGVPVPLGRKLEFLIRDIPTLDDAIGIVRHYCRSRAGQDRLTSFEIDLIEATLG